MKKKSCQKANLHFIKKFEPEVSLLSCTNKLPGLKWLFTKDVSTIIFKKYEEMSKGSTWFWPRSYCLPKDELKLTSLMKAKRY